MLFLVVRWGSRKAQEISWTAAYSNTQGSGYLAATRRMPRLTTKKSGSRFGDCCDPLFYRDEKTGEWVSGGGRTPVYWKYVRRLAKEMDAQVRAAARTNLDRRSKTFAFKDNCFPRDETVKGVLNLQPVTAFAKTFLHDSSP